MQSGCNTFCKDVEAVELVNLLQYLWTEFLDYKSDTIHMCCATKPAKFALSVINTLNCFGATFFLRWKASRYTKLTVLFPRLWTRQFRYAVLPTRAVTFLEADGSKYGPRRPVDVGIPRSSSSAPMVLRPWYASSGRIEPAENHKQCYE